MVIYLPQVFVIVTGKRGNISPEGVRLRDIEALMTSILGLTL